MNILHLSDTPLSGAPVRLSDVLAKYSEHDSRHITYKRSVKDRIMPTDLIGEEMDPEEIRGWFDWADVIHYHNRWKRQWIFDKLGLKPPKKPGVIQIHSPRESEDFSEEVSSGLPLLVIAQYHPRQWPELDYVVPNVIDINAIENLPADEKPRYKVPVISYAPSSMNAKGWDDKGYGFTAGILKRMNLAHQIIYKPVIHKPLYDALDMKRVTDMGVDEIVTGSYHMSSLEYLSMGIATFAGIDELTAAEVKKVTGCAELPWVISTPKDFKSKLDRMIADKSYVEIGKSSRKWMEKYWNPEVLCKHYIAVYGGL